MVKQSQINTIAGSILFFYIATENIIPHMGSVIVALFTIAGVVFFFRGPSLCAIDKSAMWVMCAFALYSTVYLLSFLLNGLHNDYEEFTLRYIDDEMRMLMIVPISFLFRSIRISAIFVWNGIVAGALISGGHAVLYTCLGCGSRAAGSYDAIAFGDISLVLAVMSAVTYEPLRKKHRTYRIVVPAAFLLGLAGSILSGSRGGWVAIPILFVILLSFMQNIFTIRRRLLLVGLCCFLILTAYLTPATNFAGRVESAITETSDFFKGDVRYGGATVRLLGLQASIDIFAEHPIIGAGPGNYMPFVNQMISQGKLHEMTAKHGQPASTLLATLASCGILGVLALMGVFLAPCWFALKIMKRGPAFRSIGYELLILSVSFFHFGLFETIFRRSLFTSFYILLVAVFLSLATNMGESEDAPVASTPL